MSAQHTPGPWKTASMRDGSRNVLTADGLAFICQIGSENAPDPAIKATAEADGRLIAAARGLLAALLAALRACNARLLARMHTDNGDDCSAYSAACAAIAKTDAS